MLMSKQAGGKSPSAVRNSLADIRRILGRGSPGGRSLILLAAVYGVQYLDQIMVGLFVQPIKTELALTDTEIGLIVGVAFTLFYVLCGLPLASLADRANRKMVTIICLLLFSLATAACGLAIGFATLFAARICVAVGEAGTTPASVSILAGQFDSRDRQIAMSLYSGGGFVGVAAGLLLVGLLASVATWRHIFVAAGAVGAFLSVLLIFFLVEPPRGDFTEAKSSDRALSVYLEIARTPSFFLLALGVGLGLLGSAAAMSWVPAFLARSYGLSQSHIILFLAFAWGAGAALGSVIFGSINARLRVRGARFPMIALACIVLGFSMAYALAFLSHSASLSLGAITVALFLIGGVRGPAFALVQDIVPDRHQASANALLLLITYAIGTMLGPVVTGALSDFFKASFGSESLREALLAVLVISGISAAATLFGATRYVERDVARKANSHELD
ncbi:MAG: Major facilitator family transporter [Novosphingobium sp.]|nr:Major facilitator family transporter [Novosphingobium sp.]